MSKARCTGTRGAAAHASAHLAVAHAPSTRIANSAVDGSDPDGQNTGNASNCGRFTTNAYVLNYARGVPASSGDA